LEAWSLGFAADHDLGRLSLENKLLAIRVTQP
jgi:hypothetical protein